MRIELTDDGSLDTVLRCSECGEEMRYNAPDSLEDDFGDYDGFLDWAIQDAEDEHDCPYCLHCDQCLLCSINGMACHESGCPNSRKAWDHDSCSWVDAEPSDDEQDIEDWIAE